MKTLYLLRHSTTDYNSQKKMLGITDLPLNEEGILKVHEVKESFANRGIQGVVTSDLCRARQTAEIIASHLQVPVRYDKLLRERNQGELEGMNLDFIKSSNINLMTKVDGRESLRGFMNRITNCFNAIVDDVVWDKYIVVSHNGSLRMFMSKCLRVDIQTWDLCEMKKVRYDSCLKEWSYESKKQY